MSSGKPEFRMGTTRSSMLGSFSFSCREKVMGRAEKGTGNRGTMSQREGTLPCDVM